MEIPALLEPLPNGGFRARSGDPLELTAQGDSPDSALRNLRDLIETRIASGAVLTTIELPHTPAGRHPGRNLSRRAALRSLEDGHRNISSGDRGRLGDTVSLYVMDTDLLSLYQRGHPVLTARVDAHPQRICRSRSLQLRKN